jgi:hypothetical protein
MARAVMLIASTAAAVLTFSAQAFAITVTTFDYTFSFDDHSGDSGNIIFTTNAPAGPLPDGGVLVQNVSGHGSFVSLGGVNFSGPEPVNSVGTNDNLLFSTAPFVDANGIAFDASGDPKLLLTFEVSLNKLEFFDCTTKCTAAFALSPTNVKLAPTTPLPAALPLFATGLGAMGLLGWRRKRKQAVA